MATLIWDQRYPNRAWYFFHNQALFWKHGDLKANNFKYDAAIAWYVEATKLFTANLTDSRNSAIIHRKIAYCQFKLGNCQLALDACVKAKGLDSRDNVINDYLFYLIYVELNQPDQALTHLSNISFQDRSDLYVAAADIAYQKKHHKIVRDILKVVVQSNLDFGPDVVRDIQIVLRSLIKLSIDHMHVANNDQSKLELLSHLTKAFKLAKSLPPENLVDVEIDWLFRETWNCMMVLIRRRVCIWNCHANAGGIL